MTQGARENAIERPGKRAILWKFQRHQASVASPRWVAIKADITNFPINLFCRVELTFTQPCVTIYVETSFCADGRLTAAALGRRIGSDRSVGSVVPTLGGQAFGRTSGGVRRPAPSSLTGNREVNAGPFRGANFPHNRFHREIRSIPSHLRITGGRTAQPRCRTGVATGTLSENATNEPNLDKLLESHNNKIQLRLRRILALIRDLTSR